MSSARAALLETLASYLGDRKLLALIGTTVTGVALNAHSIRSNASFLSLYTAATASATPQKPSRQPSAIDDRFRRRLLNLFAILLPSWRSRESLLLIVQTITLICRVRLSLRIARTGGNGLKAVMQRSRSAFAACLFDLTITGVVASVVNAALKFQTSLLGTSFRRRLTEHIHAEYCRSRRFYHAAQHRGRGLDHIDQRVTDDVGQFCTVLADLHSRTFKPALDVVLSTRRMAASMGYSGLLVLYSYYLAIGGFVRAFAPPFAKLVARQQALEGELRARHARLIAHAETVALLDGGARERELLDGALQRSAAFSRGLHLLQFYQGCVDQFTIKYGASMIGWPVLAVPFLTSPSTDVAEVAARYREGDTLIQSACGAIGELLLVYKKVQRLAGLTARVSELLEALEAMGDADDVLPSPSWVRPAGAYEPYEEDDDAMWPLAANGTLPRSASAASTASEEAAPLMTTPPSRRRLNSGAAPVLEFEGVTLRTPDGRLLVRDLTLRVARGRSVLVTGPNGAGKSSLLRALKGLWPLDAGAVRVHVAPSELHFVPQTPYLVCGTLRDQLLYPHAPLLVDDRDVDLRAYEQQEAKCAECLLAAGLDGLLKLPGGLDAWRAEWLDELSGGEKQRLGLARLFYRANDRTVAVLDEVTSAVNAEEQASLHERLLGCGATLISVAHRPEVRRFHKEEVRLAGDGSWAVRLIE